MPSLKRTINPSNSPPTKTAGSFSTKIITADLHKQPSDSDSTAPQTEGASKICQLCSFTAKKVSWLRLHYFRSHGFRQSSIALHTLSHDAILSISQPSQEISTTHNNSSLQPTKEISINQNTSTLQSDQNRST
ncbi:hypothetical protein NPIL_520071 [Nephila pilipes]|uniref:Uncharacterized protein n=1 Tax=Nephila pilipes TaxID=299642 RepID=A0A8X6NBC7_NEPPI|nr:hypothetical protein NPIL_520071 [Nephila pilipes]